MSSTKPTDNDALPEEYLKALQHASHTIREKAPIIEARIQDIFRTGFDKQRDTTPKKTQPELWEPIQAVVVEVDIANPAYKKNSNQPEEKAKTVPQERQYSFKGTATIKRFFGELDAKTGQFTALEYDSDGIPIGMKVPDVKPTNGVYWYMAGDTKN